MTLPRLAPDRARRQRLLPRDCLFQARRAPMRTLDEAIARGMRLDPVARQEGYDDAIAGFVFDPQDLEPLAYAAGFLAGRRFLNSKEGH